MKIPRVRVPARPHDLSLFPMSARPLVSSPAEYSSFVADLQSGGRAVMSICRPWRELSDTSAFSFPASSGDATGRLRHNLYYFRLNYVILLLSLTLLFSPIPAIFLLVIWLSYLYFYRGDRQVVVFGRPIEDRSILVGLSVLTAVVLLLSGLMLLLEFGIFVVGAHAALRATEDLFIDEEEAIDGGLVAAVVGQP